MNNKKGFSLVEMIVVTFIFVIVIMITASAFEKIISSSSQLTKAAHSNIEGIIGLELLRADLEASGFGLPWSFSNTPTAASYTECQVASTFYAVNGTGVDPVVDFNDAPTGIPRAILTKSTTGGTSPGADFLVIKSAPVGSSQTAKKWSYVNYSGPTGGAPTTPQGVLKSYGGSGNLQTNDQVITLNMTYGSDGSSDRQLIVSTGGAYSYAVGSSSLVPDSNFVPGDPTMMFVAYGINSGALSMPFNRADYFVYRPTGTNTMSSRCAPGTGNLYKASVAQTGGGYSPLTPLLDCVLDMQVSFILDPNNDGNFVATKTLTSSGVPLTAQQIREQLKSIRVQILTHEGGYDRNFTYPNASIFVGPSDSSGVALTSQGKTWTNTEMAAVGVTNWQNYRWKVYEIVVQPKNLNR